MLKHRSYSHILAVAVFTLLIGFAHLRGYEWLQQLEISLQDALMRFGRPAPADPKLVFLARDTASAGLETADLEKLFDLSTADEKSRRALNMMVHEWPWSREVYALILDRLLGAGARVVAFDFTFPKPSPQDKAFRDSLDRYRDHVVVAGNITDDLGGNASVFGVPTDTLIPQTSPRDTRIGFDNFWPDYDGVVRSAEYRWAVQYGVWQSGEDFSLAARALQKAGLGNSLPADRGSYRFRLAGPPGTFRPYSIHEIFVPKYWTRNYANGGFFRDKIVIVGASGNWQHDEHQTALGLMTGAEVQLNAINAVLHNEFLKVASWPVALSLLILAGVIALGCCLYCASPFLRMALVLLCGAVWICAQVLIFNKPGVFIPVIGPLGILSLTGLFSITYDLVSAGAERLRLRKNLSERKREQEILEAAKLELERRVEERTIELSRSNASLTTLVKEKDVLLKEIHHRVKNNLQVISSLLNLQAGYITDTKALEVFTESRNRVRSMSLIHEKLYQSQDLSRVDFNDYIRSLTSGLLSTFAGVASKVRINVDINDVMLGVNSAVPCGLIVNELVTNCFKYAFKPGQPGEIKIGMERIEPSRFRLSVADDGTGVPKGFDFRNTESLGMQIVTTLTEQLDGTVELLNGNGTTFVIDFPESTKGEEA
jgi:two-component sensor histidine kinase/CHASE2 domain-containing sensor protein